MNETTHDFELVTDVDTVDEEGANADAEDANADAEDANATKAEFDDVAKIIDGRIGGTYIVPLSAVYTEAFRNAREEDPTPAAILGMQRTLGAVEDSFDTNKQIQEVSAGFALDDNDECILGVYAGFTRLIAMKRIALMGVIESFNSAMGYVSPSDVRYIIPDGRDVSVPVYDDCISRISETSEDWANTVLEAMSMYAVRIRVSGVSSRDAYIKSIVENNQRSGSSTGAKAASCAYLREKYGMKGKEIAKETGLLQAHVSQYLLIADIPRILLNILESEEEGDGTVEDMQRELLARCIEEWGRRVYLPTDDQCAISITNARTLGPALRGYKKNSVDLAVAISLMCEICRVDEETGSANKKERQLDNATFISIVNTAKEYGALTEVQTELASDEIADLIAKQGDIAGNSDEIDVVLGHIGGDSSSDVNIEAIIGGTTEAGVADAGVAEAGVADIINDVNAEATNAGVAEAGSVASVDSGSTVDFGGLDDIGELDGEGGDDFAEEELNDPSIDPSIDEMDEMDVSITGERNVGTLNAVDIDEGTIESKPRSTLIRKAERSIMLTHTINEGVESSEDPVVRIFGCQPGLTLTQIATAAALFDAANCGSKDSLNHELSKFLDGIDAFLTEVVKFAAGNMNSTDYAKLTCTATKINLDSIA